MPQVVNYSGDITTAYKWTGLNTLNQAWSTITIPEGIVTTLHVNWGGYGGTASGRLCIWRYNGTLLADSAVISVSSGRAWRSADITPTYVQAGTYYVGVWATPTQNRVFSQATSGTLYTKTATGSVSTASGGSTESGMIPCKVDYEYTNRLKVKANSSWVSGQVSVKANGSWVKAQGIWVKSNGSWVRTTMT